MGFHVNPETQQVGACRAKKRCPFAPIDSHFTSKAAALTYVEERAELEATISAGRRHKATHELTSHALHTPMDYAGPNPTWLFDLPEPKHGRRQLPTKPRIIDTFELDGKEVAVVWEEHSYNRMDYQPQESRGYACRRVIYRSMETGEEIGSIRLGMITEESFSYSFGDDGYEGLRWYDDARGDDTGTTSYGESALSPYVRRDFTEAYKSLPPGAERAAEELLAKQKVWARSHAALKVTPPGVDTDLIQWGQLHNLTHEHAPTTLEEVEADLAMLNEKAMEPARVAMRNGKDPYIDYSVVDDAYRGRGLGESLYIYGARMLAEEGKMLTPSATQTVYAESVWRRMAGNPDLPVKLADIRYEDRDNQVKLKAKYALDFRDKA